MTFFDTPRSNQSVKVTNLDSGPEDYQKDEILRALWNMKTFLKILLCNVY